MGDTIISTYNTYTTYAFAPVAGDTLLFTASAQQIKTAYDGNRGLISSFPVNQADSILITNYGLLASNDLGVVIQGGGALIQNYGTISSYGRGQSITNAIFLQNGTTFGNVVTNSGKIASAGGDAIVSTGSGAMTVNNSGFIESRFYAITALNTGSVTLTNSGTVTGDVNAGASISVYNEASGYLNGSVYVDGGGAVYNYGRVSGLIRSYSTTQQLTVVNSGYLSGAVYGYSLYVANYGELNNSINGGAGGDAIYNYGKTLSINLGAGSGYVSNSGTINGSVSGSGQMNIINQGTITSSIVLGGANDTYDGLHGEVHGSIIGGLGDDVITGGGRREVMYGDSSGGGDTAGGVDILYGGGGDDALYGGYGNDALYGNQDNDTLYGNQGDDWAHGGQGNDFLYGGQGNDTLNGGVGDDQLFGNLGDDRFVFGGPGFGHDNIGDFGRGAGNTDVIQFGAGNFVSFADLQAHMTQVSAGVLITNNIGDTVLIVGTTVGALTADMFVIG